MNNGQRYRFSRPSMVRFDYEVRDQRGKLLLHLKKEGGAFKHSGEVVITAAGLDHRDIAMLTSLC